MDCNTKPTILYVGGFGLPDLTAAGSRAIENAKLMESLGYQVVLVGKFSSKQAGDAGRAHTSQIFRGLRCFNIEMPFADRPYQSHVFDIRSVTDVMKAVGTENLDAVIAYNYPSVALYKLRNYCRLHRVRLVAELTEWPSVEGRSLTTNLYRLVDNQIRMRIVVPRIGNVIGTSSHILKQFSGAHVVALPSMVDETAEKWELPEKIENHEPRRLIYAGSPGIGLSKDHIHVVIEALDQLSDEVPFEFRVVGLTAEDVEAAFPHLATSLERMTSKMRFYGRVSHTKAVSLLKESDWCVFVRPNNFKSNAGFPTKLAEAFGCGIPTITNGTSDIPLYLKHGENGFLLDDIQVLTVVAGLREALTMPGERLEGMKRQCRLNPLSPTVFRGRIAEFLNHLKPQHF